MPLSSASATGSTSSRWRSANRTQVRRRPVAETTPNLWSSADLDGGETSFSRYVRARAAGDDRVIALPLFLMRGFRHRCIIVRRDIDRRDAADLKGARIGLTGWPDSGNTWTRAILREAGVGVQTPLAGRPADQRPSRRRPHRRRCRRQQHSAHPGRRPLIDLLTTRSSTR